MLVKVTSKLSLADLNTMYLPRERCEQLRLQAGVIEGAVEEGPILCSLVKKNVLNDIEVFRFGTKR